MLILQNSQPQYTLVPLAVSLQNPLGAQTELKIPSVLSEDRIISVLLYTDQIQIKQQLIKKPQTLPPSLHFYYLEDSLQV